MGKKGIFTSAIIVIIIAATAAIVIKRRAPSPLDPNFGTYAVNGERITLADGKAETRTPDGGKMTTQIFGEPVAGDLNGDGNIDLAFMIAQTVSTSSSTLFYVAAFLRTADGADGTNAIFLGDRIVPHSLEITNGQIVADYLDHAQNEPADVPPTIAASKSIAVDGSILKISAPIAGAGNPCGGNMADAPVCAPGYRCAPEPGSHLPFGDMGGVCVAD